MKLVLNESFGTRQKIEYLELSEYKGGSKIYEYESMLFDFSNFTVKEGNFIGIAVIGGTIYKVFWSGWISNGAIMMYFVDDVPDGWNANGWVDEEDFVNQSNPDIYVDTDRDFMQDWYDRLDWCESEDLHPCNAGRESDFVPFFA